MDSVNNRSLFRRKSQAARDKVRQMGRVQEPQGILASFQELMQVAGRDRTQNLMPQMMQQPQPVRFQEGGDIAMEALLQGAPEPSLGQQFAATQQSAMAPQVDIAATPTPRARVEVPDIAAMVRSNLGDNEEAQARFNNVVETLSDPEAGEEQVQEVLTESFGAPNTDEGMRRVVSQITGRELPESATVDELNRAITGVALGGAIGGPRSVAARISEALLVGLQAQRETAVGRETFGQQLAVARARGGGSGVGSRDFRNPADAYQDAYQSILNRTDDFNVPEGMTREQYAQDAAMTIIRNSYTPAQLAGTRFEGIHGAGGGGTGGGAVPTLEQFLTAARQAPQNAGVSDEQLTEYYNQTYGG
jgi:hypothetical protein